MKPKIVFLFIAFISFFFFPGCEKTSNDPSEEERIDESSDLLLKSAIIDTAQYAIHIRDSYGDYIYLNSIPKLSNVSPGYWGYDGYFVHLNTQYNASAVYDSDTKTFSATLFYLSDQCMTYHQKWMSKNYFTGAYNWAKTTYTNKLRYVSCTVLKGEFPNMNTGNKSAFIPEQEYINPGPRQE